MDKITTKLMNSLNVLFLTLMGVILFSVGTYGFYDSSVVHPVGMIISFALAILVLTQLQKITAKSVEKINVNYLFVGMLVVFILIQLVFIYIFRMLPSWDFGHVVGLAERAVVPRGWDPTDIRWDLADQIYILYYPYNFSLAAVYTGLFFLFGTQTNVLFLFGIGCIALTQIFTFLFLKNNFSKLTVIKTLLILFTFYPYVSYCLIPYTDVVSLPFFAAALFIIIKNRKIQFTPRVILYFSVVIGLGSNFKILIIIPAIAYAIYWLLHFKGLKTLLVIIPLGSYFVFNLFFSSLWNSTTLTHSPYENAGITPLYFISLGLNLETMGKYSNTDYEESMSFAGNIYDQDTKVVSDFYMNKIKERLSVGPDVLTELYYNKIFYTFGVGDYGMRDYITIRPIAEENKIRIFFTEEFGKQLIFYYSQITQCIFLIAMGIISYMDVKYKQYKLVWQKTIFTGFFFYFFLFEAGSRYLLLVTPLLFYFVAEFLERTKKVEEEAE